jgi:hypothetical protein
MNGYRHFGVYACRATTLIKGGLWCDPEEVDNYMENHVLMLCV